jgi:hypothetical protein
MLSRLRRGRLIRRWEEGVNQHVLRVREVSDGEVGLEGVPLPRSSLDANRHGTKLPHEKN